MIYIRGEEWKELKCGCFFEVEWTKAFDPETKELVDIGHATNTSYISHLGGPEAFGRKLWTEAKRRRWHDAANTQVVADAAAWIWNLAVDYLYDAHQLVDWFHATEHLGLAANLAFVKAQFKHDTGSNNKKSCCSRGRPARSPRPSPNRLSKILPSAKRYYNMQVIFKITSTG